MPLIEMQRESTKLYQMLVAQKKKSIVRIEFFQVLMLIKKLLIQELILYLDELFYSKQKVDLVQYYPIFQSFGYFENK